MLAETLTELGNRDEDRRANLYSDLASAAQSVAFGLEAIYEAAKREEIVRQFEELRKEQEESQSE